MKIVGWLKDALLGDYQGDGSQRNKHRNRRKQSVRIAVVELLEPRVYLAGAPTPIVALQGQTESIESALPQAGGAQPPSSLPDIEGYDLRSQGSSFANAYFHVEQTSVSWGDQIKLDIEVANIGSTPPAETFSIGFYLSTTSTVSTSNYSFGTISGIAVPDANHVAGYTITFTLPGSNPLGVAGPYTLGMILDPTNQISEISKTNNSNQGTGKDLTSITISPPVATVTDSVGSSTDHAMNFGQVAADGVGNSEVVQTVTLTDTAARSVLTIPQNGIHLATGTNFKILGILSNKLSQAVNVATGPSIMAANTAEVWTIQVGFDPLTTGNLSDTLVLQTDDPANKTISVALTGTANPVSRLNIADSIGASNDQTMDFGAVGTGKSSTATVTLTNTGNGPLTINQNGISLPVGPFTITGITSNTQGAINLASGAQTIAGGGAETWTVNLSFAPTLTGQVQIPLTITSNDPIIPSATVSLLGAGQTQPHLVASASSVNLGSVYADGVGKQTATQIFTLTNTGQLAATINQNGIKLSSGTQFQIASVVSSTQGAINLASGTASLAGNSAETWTVTVKFDPSLSGSLTDTLSILSNDPSSPATVSLSGTGLNQPNLTPSISTVNFPDTLADGLAGAVGTQTINFVNNGTQPLIVNQNGMSITGGGPFAITSISSNTQGTINLSSGSKTIAAGGTEAWTVTIIFDPAQAGAASGTLQVQNNDPNHPTLSIGLSGSGVVPSVTTQGPAIPLHISANSPYKITWTGSDSVGTGTYSVYYDTDYDPTSGLVQIASGLPLTQNSYNWQLPASLVGQKVTIYVKLTDGNLWAGSYAAGSLTVDSANSARLLSAPITDQSTYTLVYSYLGTNYSATTPLTLGDNPLDVTAAGATLEFHVTRVPSLVDAESTTYDSLGNLSSVTDSAGNVTHYQYDQLSRLTQVTYSDGNVVNYTYDPSGNLLTMHDSTGWQIYQYDMLNRLTAVITSPTNNVNDPAAVRLGYQYDLDNLLTAVTYPNGKEVDYAYDNAGKMLSVTEKNSGQPNLVTTYGYDATTGLLTSEVRPNNTRTLYSYDTSGRLVDILNQTTSTSALILEYNYTLDAAGRTTLAVRTDANGVTSQSYAYDDLDRLAQVTYSNSATPTSTDKVVAYTFDGNGNRLTQATYANGIAAGATQTLAYAYGPDNRLYTVTDQSNVVQEQDYYDQRGNLVAKVTATGTTLYGYDARNLLVSVSDGANYTTYQYDGAGRRISQTVNGVTTRFVNDPTGGADYQTVAEMDASGNTTSSYVYGLDRISASIAGSGMYYLADQQGSVGALTNTAGVSLGGYTYDAYGQTLTNTTGTTNAFQYDGERLDQSTGLIDLRARSYDSTTGRFLQQDPLGLSAGTNEYAFVSANPINSTDYSGDQGVNWGEVGNQVQSGAVGAGDAVTFGLTKWVRQQSWYGGDTVDYNSAAYKVGYYGATAATFAVGVGEVYGGVKAVQAIKSGAVVIGEGGAGSLLNLAKDALSEDQYFTASEEAMSELQALKAANGGDLSVSQLENTTAWSENEAWANSVKGTGTAVVDLGSNLFKSSDSFYQLEQPVFSGYTSVTSFSQSNVAAGTYGIADSIHNMSSTMTDPGGVLIDQAATLVNENLKDISGATYDPKTHQLVFLGNSNPAAVQDVDLSLFTTAIQAVYGSAIPPYVTIDPSAKLLQTTFDIGNGAGVLANGQTANIPISYTPYTPAEADDMTLSFNVNGQAVSVRLNGWVMNGQGGLTVTAGGRQGMGLTLASGTSNGDGTASASTSVNGITVTMPDFGVGLLKPQFNAGSITLNAGNSINIGNIGGGGYTFLLTALGQTSTFNFAIKNTTGSTETITNVKLVTDVQEHKFGGGVDNTMLGWIMEEADRVMKELAIGKDQLTGTAYSSQNAGMPAGYENVLERALANNDTGNYGDRFWFSPNQETLQRYVDPTSGAATVVFSQSTVQLNTQSLLEGQPQDPSAAAFANFFNANYDAFANIAFPVHDPNNPSNTISVKIFSELRDAMKAVSLARFFHDNNIPLDTWWINSWNAPSAQLPTTIPTLTNSATNGTLTLTAYGGVTIKTPNTYVPNVVAQAIQQQVLAQRTAGTGDLPAQTWSVDTSSTGSSMTGMTAVAASLDDTQQTANVTLSGNDAASASTNGTTLSFSRFYNSGVTADRGIGAGWSPTQFGLQFQYPSMINDGGLMVDGSGNSLQTYGQTADTRLHQGTIRVFDNSTGQYLDFVSSMTGAYNLDGLGNPEYSLSGLNANDVPTFTAGPHQDGSTLSQDPATKNYILTRPDGSTLTFLPTGELSNATDAAGNIQTYNWTSGPLAGVSELNSITDASGQSLQLTYDGTGHLTGVTAYDASNNALRGMTYVYNGSEQLIEAEQIAYSYGTSTGQIVATTTYNYNSDGQITSVIAPDGTMALTAASDIKGRTTSSQDVLGNVSDTTFTQDSSGNVTTQSVDMGAGLTPASSSTASGLAALQYFATGSTTSSTTDTMARVTQSTDALGNTTTYGYSGNALAPTSVTLPEAGRPSISIQRNSANLPTVINDPANVGGAPEQITYTAANQINTETDAKGLVTKYTYTSWNAVATVTAGYGTALAETTTYNYDSTTKLLKTVVDALGHTVATYGYDTLGRVTSVADGDGIVTRYAYDSLGRLSKDFDPTFTGVTNFTQYTYNANDQVTQETTPTGTVTTNYDSTTHRVTSTTDLTGATTDYAYDGDTGQLTSVTQVSSGGNAVTQYVYDRLGNLAAIIAPDGQHTAFRSDAMGRTTAIIEDNDAPPATTTAVASVTSLSTITVQVTATEPILVASLKYWQVGQSESSAQTQSMRLNDQTAFSFALTGLDTSHNYQYELTLTDRVGLSQTLTDVAPVLANNTTVNYTENDPATLINTSLTVTDADNTTLYGATVTITNDVAGQDVLSFANDGLTMGNIAVSSNANGVLTLTSAGATATQTQWQAALRSVKYFNTSDNPTTTQRSVSFVVNDGLANSNAIVSTIGITAVNDPPVLTNMESAFLPYAPNGVATAITSALTLSDVDSPLMSGATIQITAGYQSGDVLGFTNANGISGAWNGAGTLTLSGSSSLANYQAALRSVMFASSSGNPAARTVSLTVNDGANNSNSVTRSIGGYTQLVGTTLNVYGTTAADTITASEGTNLTIVVDGNTSSYTATSLKAVNIYAYAGDDTIILNSLAAGMAVAEDGGDGNDTYSFNSSNPLGSVTVSDSSGVDRLWFASSTIGVNVNLGSTGSQVVNSNLTLRLASATSIENLYGGTTGSNTLIGNSLDNIIVGGSGDDTLVGSGGNDTLVGGDGNDTYTFNTSTALGADTVTDSSGIDRLWFASSTNGVNVNLGSTAAQAVNSNLTLRLASGTSIENLYGGAGNNTLTGNTLDNIIVGGSGDDTLSGGSGNDTLVGGDGNDTYSFNTSTPVGSDTVTDSSGVDRLWFVGSTNGVAVNLGSAVAQAVNSNLTLRLASATSIENLYGGSGNNTLTGNTLDNVIVGGSGDDTLSGGGGNDTLVGADGNDTYSFNTSTQLGADTVTDSSGTDRLWFVGSTNDVAVNLGSTASQVVNSNLTLRLASATSIENVYGGSGKNTLTGNLLDNVIVGGSGDDTLSGGGGNDTLVGGDGNDTYAFNTSTQLGSDTVTDSSGIDRLWFVGSTNDVAVNLGSTATQVVNSNLSLRLASATSIENAYGGSGNNILIGNTLDNILQGGSGNNILSGSDGNDTLVGGSGRNILLGGNGSDSLTGGPGEDLLLGARYINEANIAALTAILAEWASADPFDTRTVYLLGNLAGGLNGTTVLNSTTVKEDSAPDTLVGGSGRDWYLRNSQGATVPSRDTVTDSDADSFFTEIAMWL